MKIAVCFLPFCILGLIAPFPIVVLYDLFFGDKTGWHELAPFLIGGLLVFTGGHWFAFRFSKQIYPLPQDAELHGYTRAIWLIVVPYSYFMGLLGTLYCYIAGRSRYTHRIDELASSTCKVLSYERTQTKPQRTQCDS